MISIVIPTFNNLFFTQLIIGLIQQTTKIEYELIIIDNGSTEDGMQEYFDWLEKSVSINLFGEIRIIRNEENLGVAKAWNIGIREAHGEYIAIINNDILIDNDCLERLANVLDEKPEIWCISPAFTHLDMPGDWHELALRQRFVPRKFQNRAKGFFFMFRKEIINKIDKPKEGYFIDEQFGMLWFEDSDLWMRLMKAGHPGQSVNNVLIHHFESKTVALIPEAEKYKAENKGKFLKKYGIQEAGTEKNKV
jgi:GT2 family glycosyltransferase